MIFHFDFNTVVSLVAVSGIGWIGKFLYRIERRLTTIETVCKLRNGKCAQVDDET